MSLKVVIDTDIGDDIDDALALAFALSSPELDVKAVTTVYGRTDIRARLAAKILKAYGREDIPVAAGATKPILEPKPTYVPNQSVVLGRNEEFRNIVGEHAVDLITRIVEEEGEVTLVAIGPQTNIALALLRDPWIADKTRLVVMGGCISRPVAEYNIRSDPEAASIVFSSGIPITMVGLDVTLRCIMGKDLVNRIVSSNYMPVSVLSKYLRAWLNTHSSLPILHDPLAIAATFNEDLVEIIPSHIVVETHGEYTRGLTIQLEDREPNAGVCIDVREKEFMEIFEERIL